MSEDGAQTGRFRGHRLLDINQTATTTQEQQLLRIQLPS